eukprot:2416838-Lingulodinium_polyedra.AAC.1
MPTGASVSAQGPMAIDVSAGQRRAVAIEQVCAICASVNSEGFIIAGVQCNHISVGPASFGGCWMDKNNSTLCPVMQACDPVGRCVTWSRV